MSINPSFGSSSSPHNSDLSKNTCAFSMPNRHRELLFEKPLTPSDVGKLNRLVIPKQFAEKHFPLRSGSRGGSGEALLCFEDEFGRMWRFRYSYWTSSQSYVLTKGWSRYVKEKALTAGDIVSFQRRQCNGADTDRLFITWRSCEHNATVRRRTYKNMTGEVWSRSTFFPCCPNLSPEFAGRENKMVSISSNPRRLRLFGVNMEFAESESSDASSDQSILE